MIDLIEDHLAYLTLRGYSDETIEDRGKILHRLNEHLRPLGGLGRATTRGIQQFLAHPGWSRWTRATYDSHIRSAYAWWCDNGYLDGNPITWPAPRRPKLVPKPASEDTIAIVLGLPEPVRTAGLLAAYQGLRVCEIVQLERHHITEATTYIPQGKGGDPGMVVTHPAVWEHVQDRDGFLVVHHRTGRPVTAHWLGETARRWFKHAGLTSRLHGLRHWYGTALLRGGANLRTVQECMRHRSITSTAGYTKIVDEQRRAAVLSLPTPGARASG